jgi:MFS family permease
MPPLLLLFSAINLVMGTGVFVIGGILAPIAADLGVPVSAAGQAMTAYALATALLAPLFLIATGRWPRKYAMLLGLLLFAFGNAVCALAPNLALLLAGSAPSPEKRAPGASISRGTRQATSAAANAAASATAATGQRQPKRKPDHAPSGKPTT